MPDKTDHRNYIIYGGKEDEWTALCITLPYGQPGKSDNLNLIMTSHKHYREPSGGIPTCTD